MQAGRQAGRQTGRQTDRHADRQIDMQTGTQTGRQTNDRKTGRYDRDIHVLTKKMSTRKHGSNLLGLDCEVLTTFSHMYCFVAVQILVNHIPEARTFRD